MKWLGVVLFMWGAMAGADQFIVNGPVQPYVGLTPETIQLPSTSKLKMGFEVATGQFTQGSDLSNLSGAGFVGDYSLDHHWGVEGRVFFSEFTLTQPYYYQGYSYYSYAVTTQQVQNFSRADLSIGPTYRFFRSKLSPIVGVALGWSHDYYTLPVGYTQQGSADTFELQGIVGLDLRVDKDLSVGLNIRAVEPVSYSSNGNYYAGSSSPVQSFGTYMTGINIRFNF